MARVRRRRALEDFRADERERQRALRERRRRESRRPCADVSTAVSRAGCSGEAAELLGLIDESVDKALTLSRASLKRQLFAAFRDIPLNHGQTSL